MLKTILMKLRPIKSGVIPDLNKLPCVRWIFRDGIRVRVFHYEGKNGHFEYWFAVEQATSQKENWLRLSAMPDGSMQTIIDLLQQSLDSLDRGWRQLRTITIRTKTYFVDEQLLQLRNVNDPGETIDLKQMA